MSTDTGTVSSIDPTVRQTWRRVRGPLLIVGIVVVAALAVNILSSRSTGGPMDPQSADKTGARALAVLLDERGVEVRRVERLDDAADDGGSDATLLVTVPDLLSGTQLRRLRDAGYARIVLFEPGEEVLAAISTQPVFAAGDAAPNVRPPGCGLAAARRAGAADVRGPMYRAPTAQSDSGGSNRIEVCYGDGTRGSVAELPGAPTLDLVGSPSSFSNAELANEGHAALALNLLGQHERLVWYLPSLADLQPPEDEDGDDPYGAEEEQVSMWSLLPANVRFAASTVAIAAFLLMIAAARRLGPVVPETLPVVVRASEATEGRARLYRRARARSQAATVLRQAVRTRMLAALGLAGNASDTYVMASVASRTGRPYEEVERLLGDHAPQNDSELVRLADALDLLEQEVRRS